MLNLAAYLERIGYSGSTEPSAETLRALHRAHMLAVPFENLDIHLGRKIVCDESRFLHKIVNERRGGFCYELNGAFAALLRGLGFQVTLLSARVACADGITSGPEFDHLTLLVHLLVNPPVDFPVVGADRHLGTAAGSGSLHAPEPSSVAPRLAPKERARTWGTKHELDHAWLADVGFGDGFIEPLRFEPRLEQPQIGRVYRLTEVEGFFHLEANAGDGWKRQYSFTLQPRQLADFAGMCHYHQTSPESHFTRQRICSQATPRGRITLSDLKLMETRDGRREERELAGEEQWRATLRELFRVDLPT